MNNVSKAQLAMLMSKSAAAEGLRFTDRNFMTPRGANAARAGNPLWGSSVPARSGFRARPMSQVFKPPAEPTPGMTQQRSSYAAMVDPIRAMWMGTPEQPGLLPNTVGRLVESIKHPTTAGDNFRHLMTPENYMTPVRNSTSALQRAYDTMKVWQPIQRMTNWYYGAPNQ